MNIYFKNVCSISLWSYLVLYFCSFFFIVLLMYLQNKDCTYITNEYFESFTLI